MKNIQPITIWLLPLIVIGGLFYPLLGYSVIGMMVFLLISSLFKGRFWCANICPRGAFLDIIMSKSSPNKPIPKIFTKQWFRWAIVVFFMSLVVFRIIGTEGNLITLGSVFVAMCLVTTIIAVILGITIKHRGWCVICPMGTLQGRIYKMNHKKTSKKKG